MTLPAMVPGPLYEVGRTPVAGNLREREIHVIWPYLMLVTANISG